MLLREETPEDYSAIRDVNRLAFGGEVEARLIDRLRMDDAAFMAAELSPGDLEGSNGEVRVRYPEAFWGTRLASSNSVRERPKRATLKTLLPAIVRTSRP